MTLEQAMPIASDSEPLDGRTSRSICRAIGEKLQQSMPPEPPKLPDQLAHLVAEMRRREAKD
ncbi:hypothetical protein [Rhodopseudomonas palustris]|uniref:hypothetical protein n=1 Tax=Rhodopseudomonas palustris TaxID=1076 RepID=UPI0002DD23E8